VSKAAFLDGPKPWIKLAWRTSLALAGVAVGTVNVLADRDLLDLSDTKQVVIIVGLAAVTAVDNTRLAVRRAREPAHEQVRVRVQKALVGVLIAISEDKNVRMTHLGSSIFVERRVGLLQRKQLVRRFRFRVTDHPQASDVTWAKGKGVVGTCWETGQPKHRYRRPVADKWAGKQLADGEWKKLPKETQSGFTREEFVSMVGKYAEVLAVPIKDDTGELVGIVSIDLTVDAPKGAKILNGRDVEVLVTNSAALVRDDIDQL
jgi:hypothetical protein